MRDPLCMCTPEAMSIYAWHEGWQQVHAQLAAISSHFLLLQVYRPGIDGNHLQHLLTHALKGVVPSLAQR